MSGAGETALVAAAVKGEATDWVRRLIGAVVAVGCAGVLALAAWMEPAANGLGTHESLGLPPCGWIVTMDLPCPTCGMTTAFAHAADGHLLAAFHAQPFGGLMSLATAMALLVGAHVALTGSRVERVLKRLWGRRTGWVLVGVIVLAWLYKVITYKGLLS